jgi:hypothetical protein
LIETEHKALYETESLEKLRRALYLIDVKCLKEKQELLVTFE